MKLIDVSTKKHPETFAMVDDDDYDTLSNIKWTAFRKPNENVIYATSRRDIKKMHHAIMGKPINGIIDHIDGNGLNNQKSNLRVCSQSQNSMNARKWSGKLLPKGVSSNGKKFRARIRICGKDVNLGTFDSEHDAHDTYCMAARNAFGEFFNKG